METGLRHRVRRVERQISAQHRHLNPLFAAFEEAMRERAVEPARRAFDRFHDALDAHFSLEDEFFFPALHGLCPERERELAGLSRDHQRLLGELRRLGGQIEGMALEAGSATLDAFASALSAHESREEQLVAAIRERAGPTA
jgi:hypothetical protein